MVNIEMNSIKTRKHRIIIVVTGDVTIDYNIARIQKVHSPVHVWNVDNLTRASYKPGGAAMLADL